jgi:hypothetical protein
LETHLAVDKAMIAYRGRTDHAIKNKNKPIKEGYKVWVLAEAGYVWSWLWHSGEEGVESIPSKGKKMKMSSGEIKLFAPTYALVLVLA